jgi:hypothetical protein
VGVTAGQESRYVGEIGLQIKGDTFVEDTTLIIEIRAAPVQTTLNKCSLYQI